MGYLELARRAAARIEGGEDQTHAMGGPDPLDPLDSGSPLEIREEVTAIRVWSRLLGREIWLARHEWIADELIEEFPGTPILSYADVLKLAGKPPELLKAMFDVMGHLPARVIQ